MIQGSIQEEDITIINIYAFSIRVPQYIREMLATIKEEINSDTIIVGYFNTSLTSMDRSYRQERQNLYVVIFKKIKPNKNIKYAIKIYLCKYSGALFSKV